MAQLRLKHGVRLMGVQPVAVVGIMACAACFFDHDKDCIVTSVTDGRHSRGSLHHAGLAFDLRRRHLGPVELNAVVGCIRQALNEEWDVVVEATHIHCEYDPA